MLHLNIHTPSAGCCFKKLPLLFVSFILFFESHAQIKDTTQLDEITVKATKIKFSSTGKKMQKLDSLSMELFKHQTLDVLLSSTTPIFVKNYGPGALQTTTFRGGNAAQTAILWNGLNIQNSMLGQTDLSNISASLFNTVDVEYGGSSALWGSGAMGGAVHLNNKHILNNGIYTKINTMMSSIGARSAYTDIGFSNSKISFLLKAFVLKNKNEYAYKTDSNTISTRKDAAYEQLSAMPELKWLINSHNSITAGAWLNKGLRNLPNFNIAPNKIQQQDASERIYLNWHSSRNNVSHNLKVALFTELLNYSDSLAKIDSRSNMQTRIVEDEIYYRWKKNHTLNAGINYTKNEAQIADYNGSKFIEKYSFLISQKDLFLNEKLTTNIVARVEHTSINLNPLTFNLGAEYIVNKNLQLKVSGGKVYRIPTLNDLYWIPGGNKDLKPEEGYTADGTIEYSKTHKSISIVVSGSAFYKLINNWIQWVPFGVSGYQPINLQEVYSRGGETSWQMAYSKNKFKIQLKTITSYVLSTVNKSKLEGDDILNKQLIYTPRYSINSSILIKYKTLAISYFHNYIGYRFTASDNSKWLNPYHYSSIRLNYTFSLQKMELGVFGNINNVLNKQIEILENRPIALRYFELGVQLNYKKNK